MSRRNQGQALKQGLCSFSQGAQRYSLFCAKSALLRYLLEAVLLLHSCTYCSVAKASVC